MEKIIGLIDAPFTPFYENGEVNYEPIAAYAKMLAKNGLKGVETGRRMGEGCSRRFQGNCTRRKLLCKG